MKKVVCIVSRFNEEITEKLLAGAVSTFQKGGILKTDIDIHHVPGAFEVPFALRVALDQKVYKGAVVLSCVVKGGTDHDEYVAGSLTDGVSKLSLEYKIPVGYGVITANNWRQAIERSGGKLGNRGEDAARACLEMMNLAEKVNQ